MSDERLDQLIDDVARQMTRGQLSSNFRAHVIASLDRRPRRLWRPIWIVAPLGAIAAVILAIVVTRPFIGRDHGPERAALRPSGQSASPASATPGPNSASSMGPLTASAEATAVKKTDTTFRSTGRRAYRPNGAGAAAVAALAPPPLEPAPIGVEALGIEALPTESIAVRQLGAIAPISIDPLPTNDARPPSRDERPSPNDNDNDR